MSMQVKLLSPPSNYAVVHLPQRQFPGVVFQGDTLYSLIKEIEGIALLLHDSELEELAFSIEYMRERLNEVLVHYELVCAEKGISLPYVRK